MHEISDVTKKFQVKQKLDVTMKTVSCSASINKKPIFLFSLTWSIIDDVTRNHLK